VRILQVGTSDAGGGAERVAWLLHEAFLARGHDAWMAVGNRRREDARVVPLHESPHVDYRPYGWLGRQRLLERARSVDRMLGLEPFRFPYSHRLTDLTGSAPDIVHAHNLHGGYFDPRALAPLAEFAPVFLSLHDLWSFTGHCAYPFECTRWQRGCGACPDLTIPPAVSRDATHWNWRRKRRIWQRSRLHAVFASEWLREQAERSILAAGIEEARVLPNPVDLSCFTPGSRGAARARLEVPPEAHVLLFMAHGTFRNPFKDGATARAVAERLAELRTRPVWLVAVGGGGGEERIGRLVVRHVPFDEDAARVCEWYRASDLLLHATRQEVCPLVILEALACELPVVASDVAGIPEIVQHGRSGWLFPVGDADAALAAVTRTLDRPDEARALARRGGEHVRQRCDRNRIAESLLAWYEQVLARRSPPGRAVAEGGAEHPRTSQLSETGRIALLKGALRAHAPRLHHATRASYRWSRRVLLSLLSPRLGRLEHHAPRLLRIPEGYRREPVPSQPPRISIVTPCLDAAPFLERTLRSIVEQGYPALEYVVRDGGSRDGTRDILEAWAPRLSAVRSEADGGQAQALNLGFAATQGEIMAWLNADDCLLPGSLAYVARYFIEHPEVDVLYGHRILVDERDREIGRWIVPEHDAEVLRWADFVPQETLFWRRRAWEKVGGALDESFHFALDWDLLLRFAAAGLEIVRVPRFLGAFRIHAAQKTSAQSDLGRREMGRLRLRELGFEPAPSEVRRRLLGYYLRHLTLHVRYRLGLLHH